MSISGKSLYNKVRRLRPELSSSITPQILSKICDEPLVQPFVKWFCENVSHANVLSNEEIRIKNKLQKVGEWLEGPELDHALEEATHDCPDLLKLVSFDDANVDDLFAEFEIMKDSQQEDESYVDTLRNGLQNLKKLENKLDEDIDSTEILLERERIEAEKVYSDCSMVLEEFDRGNREFFKDVECLLNTYADAAENKGSSILWTQMPLELFIKQMELYNHYIAVHVRQQFGNTSKEEQDADSDYASLIDDTKEKRIDEKTQELMLCKTNLTNTKIEEVTAKVQEESCVAMLEYVQDIYNVGNMKIPNYPELQVEILELTRKRDFLEENVTLLRDRQLTEIVQQFAELETTKILKHDAQARLERRKIRLEKLINLRSLTREHGHVHADLLCMLMEMQFHCLKEIGEFVADAQHYLATEYLLSSARCESMQQQQNEYTALLSSPLVYNSFDRIFISMVCGSDISHQLNFALDKYNELITQNKEKKRMILEACLNSKISELEKLEDEINLKYTNELQEGPTHNFKAISHEISIRETNVVDSLQKVQTDLAKIRNKMKERMRTDIDFEREKDILWQRFLADPDTLRKQVLRWKPF